MIATNGPVLITAATANPVTTAEAKSYCLIDGSVDDTIIGLFLTAATDYVQRRLGQQLMPATFRETWDDFCGEWDSLTLNRTPVSSVSFVKYYDTAGTLTTVDSGDYWADLNGRPPRIMPTASYTWPTVQLGRPESVQVQYVAGYANAAAVPEAIKVAVKALVKHWYDLRGPVITSGAIPKEIPHSLEAILNLFDSTGYR